jgi:hypothetical protein
VNAGQHVVLVAVDQRDSIGDRSVKRRADIVGVDDCGEMSETGRKREGFVPGKKLALLDVDASVREFGDRAHVIKMGMGYHNVGDRLGRELHFAQHSHWRYPGRDAEL